jgi:AI-2 transport protein TqsA
MVLRRKPRGSSTPTPRGPTGAQPVVEPGGDPSAPSGAAGFAGGPGTGVLVSLAALTVVAVGMSAIRTILAPVLLTLVLALCANPVRTALHRHGVPQALATGAMMITMTGVLAAFAATALVAVSQFVEMLPAYEDEFAALGANVAHTLRALGVAAPEADAVANTIDPGAVLAALGAAAGGVFSFTGALVIVLTMIILMSSDAVYTPTILGQLRRRRPFLVDAMVAYSANVRRYMVVTALLGVAQGVLNALALVLLQVPAALLWGVLAFVCSFIPNVGYFVALVPPVVFGGLVGGWPTVVMVVIVYGVVNAVVQSVVQPRVVGQAVSLSQTVTFFSVLFWAVVIGPIGAILAIPLTLLGKAVLVDANPQAELWRPTFGPTEDTRALHRAETSARRTAARRGKTASGSGAP